jgi:hypothetical protein
MFRRQFRSGSKSPAWQRKEGKSKSGGLNRKGIASYRAANPGSKLSMAVTTKPSSMISGGVTDMEKYKYLLGQAHAYNIIDQEISNLLNKEG